jgi:hypothetical protein
MTTDEGIHVASAYLALTRGEHRFDPEHPFLFKYLTALPILVLKPNLPADDARLWEAAKPTYYDSWKESREWSDQWIYTSGNNAQLMLFLARIPGVLSLVALCWLVWFATRHWFGNSIARWAVFFTALNPTLLAHGPLTNTDVPVALASLFVIWRLWLYFEDQKLTNVLWVSLSLGIALTTKYSALIMLPVGFVWLIYTAIQKHRSTSLTLAHALTALVGVWFFIWTVYFWQSPLFLDGTASKAVGTASDIMQRWGMDLDTFTQQARWLLPSAYIKGALLTIGGSIFGRSVYFLAESYATGVWFYFPTMLVLKSQLVTILLLVTGIFLALRRLITPWAWRPVSVLLIIAAAFIVYTSLTSKLNLGIRHISSLMPLLSIFLATTTVYLKQVLVRKGFVIAVITSSLLPVIFQSHDLIGFRNSIVFPKEQTYRYFNDSNLDWGQQSERIAELVRERYPNTKLYVNYKWNPYALTYYGLSVENFNPLSPPNDSLIAVTATQLGSKEYSSFTEKEPDYILDTTTYFYLTKSLQ